MMRLQIEVCILMISNSSPELLSMMKFELATVVILCIVHISTPNLSNAPVVATTGLSALVRSVLHIGSGFGLNFGV
jgi:hypothetical protein